MKKILIGGIGSVLLGDDGVGPHVIRLLESRYTFDESIAVVDLGTPGLDLVAHLSGVDVVILIDSVKNDAPAGAVTLYRRDDILCGGATQVRMDPHSPALSESLLIADFTGEGADEVLLIGITGQQYEVGTSLSAAVQDGAVRAIDALLAELNRLGAGYSDRAVPDTTAAWWEPVSELPLPVN